MRLYEQDFTHRLTGKQRDIWRTLVDFAKRYATVYPSVAYLAEHSGCVDSTVYEALLRFEDLGWLRRGKLDGEGRWRRNCYELLGDMLVYVEQCKAAAREAIAKRLAALQATVADAVAGGVKAYRQAWAKLNRKKQAEKSSPPIFGDNLCLSKNKKERVSPQAPKPAFLRMQEAGLVPKPDMSRYRTKLSE